MRKWMFVICPAILFIIFFAVYRAQMSQIEEHDRQVSEAAAKAKAEDQARKDAAAAQAKADAAKRAAEQAAEEKAREDKIDAEYASFLANVKAETDQANAKIAQLNGQISGLKSQLDDLRKHKEEDSNQEFDLNKQVEVARINQRTAELEIQRMVDMIAKKADASSMTRPPPVLPPVS